MIELAPELVKEYANLYAEDHEIEANDDCKIIEEGDWRQDSKYQFRTTIVEYKGILIAVSETRSGSPFSDWFYNDTHIIQCERKEEVKIVVNYVNIGKHENVARE